MSNTFPKTYVLDRIAARKASLQSKITAGETAADAYDDHRRQEIIAFMEARAKKLTELAAQARKWASSADASAPADDLYAHAQQMQFTDRAEPPATARRGQDYAMPRADQVKRQEIKKGVDTAEAARRELALLDHAEAYLKDTPVDEFTITGLKQLGLLEAVKFDLGAVSK